MRAAPLHRFIRVTLLAFAICWLAVPARSQAVGPVVGRFQDATTGRYLYNARVTVVGASRDVFTNQDGEFQIAGLAAGEVTLRVYYTGDQPQTVTVTVTPG